MKSPFESSHRSLIICLAIAFVVLSVLIIEAVIAAPTAKAATSATVQQSAPPMPPCMRRVTVTSKPCGAMIYIDGIQVGRTPMSFPMPTGRYTLVLLAPGHQQYAQRILVPDAPLEIDANLVPMK